MSRKRHLQAVAALSLKCDRWVEHLSGQRFKTKRVRNKSKLKPGSGVLSQHLPQIVGVFEYPPEPPPIPDVPPLANWLPPEDYTIPERKRYRGSPFRARLYERCPLCCWCGEWLPFAESTIEHLTRRTDGGGNTMENCRIACGPCNWSRGPESDPAKVVELARRWRIARELKRGAVYRITPPKPIPVPGPAWDNGMDALLAAIADLHSLPAR